MGIDVGPVGTEWLVVILAVALLVALIGGPLRDVGWRRGIEAELRIAEKMRDLAASDDAIAAAARFAERVIAKADDLERRSSNVHAVRNFAFKIPFTLILTVVMSGVMFYMVVWKGGDPANIPLSLFMTLACGLTMDITRPAFLSPKRPDGRARAGKGEGDGEIHRGE